MMKVKVTTPNSKERKTKSVKMNFAWGSLLGGIAGGLGKGQHPADLGTPPKIPSIQTSGGVKSAEPRQTKQSWKFDKEKAGMV